MHERLRGDLIEAHKIMRGIDKVMVTDFFSRVKKSRSREYKFKVRGEIFKEP